jgi:hypothetical protein
MLAARLAIPLFEGLAGDLPFDEKLRELAALCLTFERHLCPSHRVCPTRRMQF